ncbi:heme exporter protein CcmD [Candidatus Magnetaquicoccus inordinatus]|nr:heme exporter protein CcmD [Candidatus Magnetaquicoccus inordinatus]
MPDYSEYVLSVYLLALLLLGGPAFVWLRRLQQLRRQLQAENKDLP